ncbi:MAG: SwmB domain-containing protein, partial [Bacteroidia bacterium]|nr:SwmB domain-containing protein [Bacteroidia bacterium]
ASPITYGDAVTVAYTKPFSNPLQTSDGGEAASFPSKSVTNNVSPPPNPVYVNSAIENSTPSVLEITYSLTLANIVPAISSFSVQVNSAARTISSVTVSGTKVLLTLASPVAYGNVIAVSYTVPSSNPLQTADGGKAVSISAKSVTNKINAPPGPVYSSSVIENATPSLIEITYNLSLANIVPAASAFSVNVNSAARSISSVSISGTKVLLTLASPVVYGNTVTVAYTKPSTNPLQTTSGGQAATISAQTVTNKVNAVSQPVVVVTPPAVVNAPPVVVVNNISGTYSGFVGKINASGSYDTNKDNLTYSWKVPGTIPVSATNSSIIEFLAPIVDANQTYEFTLTVSDGKTPQTKTVPVTIIPYEPGLEKADVLSVEAASYQSPYYPYNILDGNVGTMWSVNGYDQWIILELNGTYTIQHVELAFQPGQKKEFYFDIFGSNDKENWEPVLSKSRSCAFSGNLQVFDFPASKTEKEFRYVKLVGQGNSVDQWNYIAEFRIFGYRHKNPVDYEDQIVKIYPNPAHELVNILIDEPTFVPDFIKIVSLTGKIFFDSKVDPDIKQFQIPIDFKQGIYLVQMGTGDLTVFTQKLIVTNCHSE